MIVTDTQIVIDRSELPVARFGGQSNQRPDYTYGASFSANGLEAHLLEVGAVLLDRRAFEHAEATEAARKYAAETAQLASVLGGGLSADEYRLLDVLGGAENVLTKLAQRLRDSHGAGIITRIQLPKVDDAA